MPKSKHRKKKYTRKWKGGTTLKRSSSTGDMSRSKQQKTDTTPSTKVNNFFPSDMTTPQKTITTTDMNAPSKGPNKSKFNFLPVNDAKQIGNSSANGSVFQFKEEQGNPNNRINSDTTPTDEKYVLKTSQDQYSDNLFYEYKVGQYINGIKKKYDCFVTTYELYITDEKTKGSLNQKTGNNLMPFENIALEPTKLFTKKNDDDYIEKNMYPLCHDNVNFVLQQEMIDKGKTMFTLMVEEKKLQYKSLQFYLVLYQIYKPLLELQNEFSHNDLHMNNILLVKEGKKISINNREHTCQYHAYIIDYGRCYFPGTEEFLNKYNEELWSDSNMNLEKYNKMTNECGLRQIRYDYRPDLQLFNTLFSAKAPDLKYIIERLIVYINVAVNKKS